MICKLYKDKLNKKYLNIYIYFVNKLLTSDSSLGLKFQFFWPAAQICIIGNG